MAQENMETTIAIAVVVLVFAVVLVMFWSASVSKQLSAVVFSTIFFVIAVVMIVWQGFTQQVFRDIGFIALALFVIWLRFSKSIADTARARGQLKDRLSQGKYATCEVCGSKNLTYHRVPKNASQLLLGGLTCNNCGTEINVPFDIFLAR
jgi:hypothetical protein